MKYLKTVVKQIVTQKLKEVCERYENTQYSQVEGITGLGVDSYS